MKKTVVRNSNHELMRIIAMFFIVLGHVILKGHVLATNNANLKTIYLLIVFAIIVHVNTYILLTGYYQSKTTFKEKKLWKIINANWFYRIIIVAIFCGLNLITVTKVQLLKDISIFPRDYWFITCYILLYCISPFLNKLINSLSHSDFKKLLIVATIILSVLPTITNGEVFKNDGYTLYNCIYLYLVGAYLRIYPLDKSYIFKRNSRTIYRIALVSVFFLCILLNFLLYNYAQQVKEYNGFFAYLSEIIDSASLSYSNPLIIVQSIVFFLFFTSIDIKSRFINWYAKLMLGIYMIHEQHYVREVLYKWLGVVDGPIDTYKFLFYVIGVALLIFVTCSIIELIRQIIFKFIYNRKFAEKIREKYYLWLKNI